MNNQPLNQSNFAVSKFYTLVIWFILTIIFIGTAPSAVAQPLMAAAAQNSVTLTWTAPGDDGFTGQASAYSIRYSQSPVTLANWSSATEASNLPTPQPAGSSESFDVSGLDDGTLYYLAIRTVDESDNWSGLSNIVSITTDLETQSPMAVLDLLVTDSSSTSLTLSWTAPGDDDSVGTASQYELRYSTSPINVGNFSSASLVTGLSNPQLAGSNESFEVTGLNSSTVYYFALITADEIPNWSSLSNVANKSTTIEIISPDVIADLSAQNATETTIELVWTAPGDDGSTGQATQYEIRYSTSPINSSNWSSAQAVSVQPVPSTAGTNESFTVSGLSSATVYYFAIRTADEVPNWSGISNLASLLTGNDQTPPSAIGNLEIAAAQ